MENLAGLYKTIKGYDKIVLWGNRVFNNDLPCQAKLFSISIARGYGQVEGMRSNRGDFSSAAGGQPPHTSGGNRLPGLRAFRL